LRKAPGGGTLSGMQAFLDDAPLALERDTFAGALEAAKESARRRGRVVSAVFLDGSPVRPAILQSPPETPLGREVRVLSEDAPGAAVAAGGGLQDALAALDEATTMQARAAELIQTARLEEALRPLASAIQAWQTMQQAAVRELSWAEGSEALTAMLSDLAAKLRGVHSALRRQDWSALSDALAYDMKEQAEAWRMLIVGLSGAAE
jgi:hypothetical protein